MISLARHIELLLLEHDCVIVPGLGGFIANYAEANYNSDSDSLFLPPYRTIGFNQQLQVNDGLLVQSYMSAYDASYPAASLQMEKEIEQMLFSLNVSGEYVLEGIGTLKKSINNNITLLTQESGVLTPSLYGLYSFEMLSLENVIKQNEIEQALTNATSATVVADNTADTAEVETQKKDVVIRLRRRWIDVAISAAAAVLLFFCFTYPALKATHYEGDTCVAAVCNNVEPLRIERQNNLPSETAISNVGNNANANASSNATQSTAAVTEKLEGNTAANVSTPVANTPQQEAKQTENKITAAKAEQSNNFTIVLASYVAKANAEEFISKLAKSGLVEGKFVKNGKVSRIIYSSYATESEAHAALSDLRKQNSNFAEAWVMKY